MSDLEFQFNPLETSWELGYWDQGWSEPDCKQHWEDGINNSDVMSIDEALNRAIELGLLQSQERETVREICLTQGEFMSGGEDCSGWMIGHNEDKVLISPYPEEPLWFLLLCKNENYCVCPILSKSELSELRASRYHKILTKLSTLPEILALVFPNSTSDDINYQKAFLTCLTADSDDSSYIYSSSSGRLIQICRQYTDEEESEYTLNDDESFNEELDE